MNPVSLPKVSPLALGGIPTSTPCSTRQSISNVAMASVQYQHVPVIPYPDVNRMGLRPTSAVPANIGSFRPRTKRRLLSTVGAPDAHFADSITNSDL